MPRLCVHSQHWHRSPMTHDELQTTLQHAYSVKLLVSPNAPLILSFLYAQFKQPGRVTASHHELIEALDEQLDDLRAQDARRYPSEAQAYLRQWCDEEHRFLRKYFAAGQDDPVYELTSHAERAIEWMMSLRKADFIGAESRFLRILDLLKEIVVNRTPDAALRLRHLEAQRAAIEAQIEALNTSQEAASYSETQLKERLFEAYEGARRLLADFREVEENFRGMARSVHEQQFQLGARKGEIVRYFLNAEDAIKDSDQGPQLLRLLAVFAVAEPAGRPARVARRHRSDAGAAHVIGAGAGVAASQALLARGRRPGGGVEPAFGAAVAPGAGRATGGPHAAPARFDCGYWPGGPGVVARLS